MAGDGIVARVGPVQYHSDGLFFGQDGIQESLLPHVQHVSKAILSRVMLPGQVLAEANCSCMLDIAAVVTFQSWHSITSPQMAEKVLEGSLPYELMHIAIAEVNAEAVCVQLSHDS